MDQHMYSEKPAVFSPRFLKISAIGLRILTTIFLFLSLTILITKVTAHVVEVTADGEAKDDTLHFYDLVGYRYMTATMILGGAYSIWQTVTTVIRLKKGYEGNLVLEYYGDKVMSIALATGSVAGFVMTGELQRVIVNGDYIHRYFKMGYAADGFVFLGFICARILSELSSYALPKRF